ncbi:Cholecystokinin [Bagarius yarrelli]|uniref:Cholecystokinin n=1 Tax=Bagarius yarrelli TaxID=175774 RepID=A0A556TQ73_BAGYA|nr:Cholecystokinin [Bagarius yarrelli]
MNAGISVLVLLVALSSSCSITHSTHVVEKEQSNRGPVDEHTRHTRAVPPTGQLDLLMSKTQEENVEMDAVRRLNELLARLISKKGSYRRSPSFNSRSNHRIKDRDYLGWMDFGRRSAEEYEYSS